MHEHGRSGLATRLEKKVISSGSLGIDMFGGLCQYRNI